MADYTYTLISPNDAYPPKYAAGMEYSIDFEFELSGALANADTISTPAGALPNEGIRIIDTLLVYPELDTNATPTGTFDNGDADNAARFVDGAPMGVAGVTTAGFQLRQGINIAQGKTDGVVTTGAGYLYPAGTDPVLVTTVTAAVATGAASGTVRQRVIYSCSGE